MYNKYKYKFHNNDTFNNTIQSNKSNKSIFTPIQNNIISKLDTLITQLKTLKMSSESFDNDNKNDYSIVLPTISNDNEINKYINIYNDEIALLDDPKNMEKISNDTYMHIKNKKLEDLKNKFDTLNTSTNKIKKQIKGIKSLNNSKILNVETYPNPTATSTGMPSTYSGNNATQYPYYLIYGNNGCLEYIPTPTNTSINTSTNTSTKTSTNTSNNNQEHYNFNSCNANNPNQQFLINKIPNITNYNNAIPTLNPNNLKYQIKDTSSVQYYGFSIINPSTDTNQCLQLNNDGLSVIPCTLETSQRFKELYNVTLE